MILSAPKSFWKRDIGRWGLRRVTCVQQPGLPKQGINQILHAHYTSKQSISFMTKTRDHNPLVQITEHWRWKTIVEVGSDHGSERVLPVNILVPLYTHGNIGSNTKTNETDIIPFNVLATNRKP